MTSYTGAAASQGGWQSGGPQRCGFRMGWHPLEIAAVVIGFMVWWPIGLAILAMRIAHRRGFDFGDAARRVRDGFARGGTPGWQADWHRFTSPSSGNAAFDEWRTAELSRLEEERRKLDEAHRDFVDHMNNLRKARDREEFERFMNARRGTSAA